MAKTYGLHKCLQFGLAGLLGWLIVSTFTSKTQAQQSNIVPDNTLGAESSQVIGNFQGQPIEVITGGAIRQINLFHSFREFNISEGRAAYFFSPNADIQNILARVTGNNRSEILGILRTYGRSSPNLFLMNPNGIVFGKNASLNIQGAFTATTANSLIFPNGVEFSATNPQAPPLLTINVPIGLQFGSQPGSITSQAISRNQQGDPVNGLGVLSGSSTLALIGGEITLDDSLLFARNGQVKLGAVGGDTTVGLNVNGSSLGFNFPENIERAAINVTNRSLIAATGNNPIEIFGGQISLNGSVIYGENGGSVVVDATQLNLNSSVIGSVTNSAAKGGDIQIQASDAVNLANGSSIISNSDASATGTGGDIIINTKAIAMTDGGSIITQTSSSANAANIFIKASEYIEISGIFPNRILPSGVLSATSPPQPTGNGGNNLGNSGDIFIETSRLRLSQGGQITTTSLNSTGNAGNITIRAQDVELDGFIMVPKERFPEGALSEEFKSLATVPLITNLSSNVYAASKADVRGGTITVDSERLQLSNGAYLSTSVIGGQGQGGSLVVRASDSIDIIGVGPILPKGVRGSGLFAELQTGGIGEGGSISVETGRLNLNNGGQISALTLNQGNAGSIAIRADEINLRGQITSITTQTQVKGDAGDISISTQKLNVQDGAQINSGTFGNGSGGNLTVQAADTIELAGSESGLFSTVDPRASGKGGNLNITTGRFIIRDGAEVASGSLGNGEAGNIKIRATLLEVSDKSSGLFSSTNAGNGGDISLDIGDLLLLRRGGLISTTAGLTQAGGDGGNIDINAKFIVAPPQENSDIRANAFQGRGGNVQINSQGIFGIEARPKPTENSDITASSELGVSGTININVPDTSSIQNSFTELFPSIDTNALIASSCIARATKRQENSFTIPGSGALPTNRPGVSVSTYTTGEVRGVETTSRSWKKGDPIIEAQGFYRLDNGRLLLSRECS